MQFLSVRTKLLSFRSTMEVALRFFVFLVSLLMWLPSAAWAVAPLTPAEVAALLKGETVVRVTADPSSKSIASGNAFAAIDIPAPPAAVFAVLTDCARAKRIVKNMVSCKVLQRDPGGAWEVRETMVRLSVALPDFRAVARLDFVRPTQLRFKQTEGNFDYAQGQWDLMGFREGRSTRAFYRIRAGTSVPIPEFVIQGMIQNDLPETLKALRAEVLRGLATAPR